MSLESEITGWNALSLTSQAFVAQLLDEGHFNLASIDGVMPMLLEQSDNEARIQQLIAELNMYRVSERTAKDPRVVRGWQILRLFVERNRDVLLENEAAISVCGSFLYDDSVKGDGDVVIHLLRNSRGIDGKTISLWRDELTHLLGLTGEADICMVSIQDLQMHNDHLTNTDYVRQHYFSIFLNYLAASPILNGDLTLSPSLPKA